MSSSSSSIFFIKNPKLIFKKTQNLQSSSSWNRTINPKKFIYLLRLPPVLLQTHLQSPSPCPPFSDLSQLRIWCRRKPNSPLIEIDEHSKSMMMMNISGLRWWWWTFKIDLQKPEIKPMMMNRIKYPKIDDMMMIRTQNRPQPNSPLINLVQKSKNWEK